MEGYTKVFHYMKEQCQLNSKTIIKYEKKNGDQRGFSKGW